MKHLIRRAAFAADVPLIVVARVVVAVVDAGIVDLLVVVLLVVSIASVVIIASAAAAAAVAAAAAATASLPMLIAICAVKTLVCQFASLSAGLSTVRSFEGIVLDGIAPSAARDLGRDGYTSEHGLNVRASANRTCSIVNCSVVVRSGNSVRRQKKGKEEDSEAEDPCQKEDCDDDDDGDDAVHYWHCKCLVHII